MCTFWYGEARENAYLQSTGQPFDMSVYIAYPSDSIRVEGPSVSMVCKGESAIVICVCTGIVMQERKHQFVKQGNVCVFIYIVYMWQDIIFVIYKGNIIQVSVSN